MKNKWKSLFSCLLCALLLCAAIPMCVSAADYSGFCGTNVKWTLNMSTGVLSITGSGSMRNYSGAFIITPWYQYRNNIYKVTVGSGVTTIGNWAFDTCRFLTSVTLSNTINHIGEYAFYNCGSLITMRLPDSLLTIGDHAFDGCTSYSNISIPGNVTSIGKYAFTNCTEMISISIPASVTTIKESAFASCKNLETIRIADGVTRIGSGAFDGTWYYNRDYLWTDGVLYIGHCLIAAKKTVSDAYEIKADTRCIADGAFQSCRNLISVTIPESVSRIPDKAFYSCTSLSDAAIPSSVTEIGKEAFYGCCGLTSVTVPNNVSDIGSDAFHDVLNVVYTGSAVGSPWGAKYVNKHIEGPLVFDSAEKQTILYCDRNAEGEVAIPESVTVIGEDAFRDCVRLEDVSFGIRMKRIEQNAFVGCTALCVVRYDGTLEQWSSINIEAGNESLLNAERICRPPEPLTLSETALTLVYKNTKMLAASRAVVWNTSDPSVVTVDASGRLTAVGKGSAWITATDEASGDTVQCEVTVKYSFVQILIRIFLFGWIWY